MSVKTCAPPNVVNCWENINFNIARNHVKKLQIRIAKAQQDGDVGKVVSLQHRLIHSFYSKALSVKIVTSNKGRYTPGVDNVLWITPEEKWKAIFELNRRGYKPKPLKRVYIKKPDGRKRPLSIPTMKDRAQQTLYKFTLEPIAEVTADSHSYGFRAGRSTRDAIITCYRALAREPYPEWILEADIKACFDNILHQWIMEHVPMDKEILWKFLKSGYLENGRPYPTRRGIPQGGSISTVICNMVLDGLEDQLHTVVKDGTNIQFIRYVDDFIVIGTDKDELEQTIIPVIERFLTERGLRLSPEKTVITHINNGFDFLGWNVRRVEGQLSVTPSEKNLRAISEKIGNTIKLNSHKAHWQQYTILKPIIRGWLNYHIDVITRSSLYQAKSEILAGLYQLTKDKHLMSLVESLFPIR